MGRHQVSFRESRWLNPGMFVASAYNRVDVLLLRRLVTPEAVAIYAAPYRILDLTQIVPASLIATILPSLCRVAGLNEGILHPRAAMRYLLVIAFFIVVIVTMGAPWITLLLFGGKYHDSIPVLQVLIWAIIPMFWNFVLNAQLIASSYDRSILYAACIALVLNVSLNLLLIPRFGYMACAAATVITEFSLLGANLHFVSKIRGTMAPEYLGRLVLSTVLFVCFCLCWCLVGARYLPIAVVLLD